jgi:ParB family chromosome partitioning protein
LFAANSVDFRALEDRFRDALGTQVRLVGSLERGKLEVEYFSADELDDLISKLEG